MTAALLALTLAGQVSLQWNAPATCPSRDVVLDRIGVLIGAPLVPTAPVRLSVTATVTASADRFAARFIVHDTQNVRALSAPRCEDVAEAIAVIIALALDTTPPPPPPPTTPVRAPPSLKPVRPRSTTDRAPRARSAPIGFLLGVDGGAEIGSRPKAGPTVELRGGVTWWRLSIEVGYLLRPGEVETVGPGVGVETSMGAFTLRLCHAHFTLAGETFGCFGAELGVFRIEPFGTTGSASEQPWRATTFGLGHRIRLFGPVFGALRLQAVVPATRPDIRLDGQTPIFGPAAVGFSGGIGIDVLFL